MRVVCSLAIWKSVIIWRFNGKSMILFYLINWLRKHVSSSKVHFQCSKCEIWIYQYLNIFKFEFYSILTHFCCFRNVDLREEHIKNGLKFASQNLNYLHQLVEGDPAFQWTLPDLKKDYIQPNWMPKLISEFEHVEFAKQPLVTMLRKFAKQENVNFGQMMRTLRMLLSSNKDGYQVAEMLEILGKESSILRLLRTNATDTSSKAQHAC